MPTFMIVAMYVLAAVAFCLIVFPPWKSRWVTLGYGMMLAAVCIGLVWLISAIVS